MALTAAAASFTLVFTAPAAGFWFLMTVSVTLLCILAWVLDPAGFRKELMTVPQPWWKTAVTGAVSAGVLYLVFWAGDALCAWLTAASRESVEAVYRLKDTTDLRLIAVLLCLIGPAEEIFWRGYVVRTLTGRYRLAGSVAAVLAYTLVHVATGNVMLMLAALVCGAFWTVMFLWYRNLWMNIISHTLWDLAVFIVFPFT